MSLARKSLTHIPDPCRLSPLPGCPNLTTCQQAIRGSGTLTFLPADDEETASVTVVWGLVPQQALLRVGLALTPVSNAAAAPGAGPAAGVGAGPGAAAGAAGAQQGQGDGLADANATTAVYVFGTTYGTCPAGRHAGAWATWCTPYDRGCTDATKLMGIWVKLALGNSTAILRLHFTASTLICRHARPVA